MTFIPLLVALLLVSSLSATMLAASAATARLSGDRHLAVEAAMALETALARARVTHATTLDTLSPGSRLDLAATSLPGWQVQVAASREATGDLLWLQVSVERRNDAGQLLAADRGTLILTHTAADTAIVIESRPRF